MPLTPSSPLFDVGTLLSGLFRHYVLDDFNFVGFLIVFLVLDTATGVRASLIRRTHNSRQFRQVFRKIYEYAVVLVVVNGLTSLEIDGKPLNDHEFFLIGAKLLKAAVYIGLLWTETKSIDENLRRAGGNGMPLPTWFRRMMADLDERGPVALQRQQSLLPTEETVDEELPPPPPVDVPDPATSIPSS